MLKELIDKLKIYVKDIKVILSKLIISKNKGYDEIQAKTLKYSSLNESFINAISNVLEKWIEYEIIL